MRLAVCLVDFPVVNIPAEVLILLVHELNPHQRRVFVIDADPRLVHHGIFRLPLRVAHQLVTQTPPVCLLTDTEMDSYKQHWNRGDDA